MPDLPRSPQLGERPDGLLDRHLGVDDVQLVEVDALDTKAAEARLARRPEILGPSVGAELPRAFADRAALRRDHDVGRVRVQRLGDQLLAHVGAVRVGGVEELDPEVDRMAEQAARRFRVVGRPEASEAGERHPPVAETPNGEIAADREELTHRSERTPPRSGARRSATGIHAGCGRWLRQSIRNGRHLPEGRWPTATPPRAARRAPSPTSRRSASEPRAAPAPRSRRPPRPAPAAVPRRPAPARAGAPC